MFRSRVHVLVIAALLRYVQGAEAQGPTMYAAWGLTVRQVRIKLLHFHILRLSSCRCCLSKGALFLILAQRPHPFLMERCIGRAAQWVLLVWRHSFMKTCCMCLPLILLQGAWRGGR